MEQRVGIQYLPSFAGDYTKRLSVGLTAASVVFALIVVICLGRFIYKTYKQGAKKTCNIQLAVKYRASEEGVSVVSTNAHNNPGHGDLEPTLTTDPQNGPPGYYHVVHSAPVPGSDVGLPAANIAVTPPSYESLFGQTLE